MSAESWLDDSVNDPYTKGRCKHYVGHDRCVLPPVEAGRCAHHLGMGPGTHPIIVPWEALPDGLIHREGFDAITLEVQMWGRHNYDDLARSLADHLNRTGWNPALTAPRPEAPS